MRRASTDAVFADYLSKIKPKPPEKPIERLTEEALDLLKSCG